MTLQDAVQLAYGARVTTDAVILAEVDIGPSPYEFGQELFALGRECPAGGDERRGWLDACDAAWDEVAESDIVTDDEGTPSWMYDDSVWGDALHAWDAIWSNEGLS